MDIQNLLIISVGAIFISNFVLSRFLGLCPYIGVSKQLDSALGMGMAVVFVMSIASLFTWMIYYYFLEPSSANLIFKLFRNQLDSPPDLRYLQTIAFILVIATLVQFVEMVIQKTSPGLYRSLGIYLPLITTNCAVLGVAFLNIDSDYNFIESIVNGFASGVGFTLALVLMAGLREKLEMANVPKAMKGAPIAFIMAGLMSLAFMGFSGLSFG
ncbi:electron transport complex subunit RsxA [candidate division KSB1 bacterium]|nr:electron transport complex subunit RsxA [candidate division KSB1 bacterium]